MSLTLLRAATLALLAGCASGSPTDPAPSPNPPVTPPTPSTETPTLSRTVLVTGLQDPWDLAVLADGTIFYTQKCGGLSVRRPNGQTTNLFGGTGYALVATDFFCAGQSGMHGVALDPQFATNRTLYVFMASTLPGATSDNRVVRLVLNADYTVASQRQDIVTGLAYKNASTPNGGVGAHSGGRIRFGPDGFLYIGTGDNHDGALPQSPTRLGGKVLRVTRDGAAAPGNNAPSGFDARIYTYGHRNVQGLTFRPGTGQPFSAEHGPNHSDEVTPLVAGGNAGWDPQNRSGLSCPGSYCGYSGTPTTMPMTDLVRFPNALRPSFNNQAGSQGMGPLTFLSGTQWKAWDGRLLVGFMAGGRVDVLTLDSAGLATAVTTTSLPTVTRYRSLVQGADGNLYVSTDAGEIWRVVPS